MSYKGTAAAAPLVVTGALWRILDTSKHSAEQHATLTANQHNSTATQLRLMHKTNTSRIKVKNRKGKKPCIRLSASREI